MGSAVLVVRHLIMTFKKPSTEVAWATGFYIVFGTFGAYMGVRDSSMYMTIMCPMLVFLSIGVWFQSKASAIGLICISIAFTIIGIASMFLVNFSVSLLFRVFAQIFTTIVLWLWVKGYEV